MKRAPSRARTGSRPAPSRHGSGNVIDFPMVQDLASLLWVVNLGCIDLNQWYARCDDVDRPDYLHFDLDPVPGAGFERVRGDGAAACATTSTRWGCRATRRRRAPTGIHVYVPIVRGPTQKQVWGVAKAFAQALARPRPELVTAEYRIAKRPEGRVLVDYNQNAWGRTLASIYSVAPQPERHGVHAGHVGGSGAGVRIEDFRMDNVPGAPREAGRSLGAGARPHRAVPAGDAWRDACRSRPDYPPMEARLVDEIPRGARAGSTSPSGTASAASRSATARRSSCSSKAGQPLGALLSRRSSRRARVPAQRFVLDGEIVVPVERALSFDELLLRIHPAASRVAQAGRRDARRMLRRLRSARGRRGPARSTDARWPSGGSGWRRSRARSSRRAARSGCRPRRTDVKAARAWLSRRGRRRWTA